MGPHPELISAMRADHIRAPQDAGLWYVQRQDFTGVHRDHPGLRRYLQTMGAFDQYDMPHVMTSLCRWTDATIHLGQGEAVMSDDPVELRKHLPVVLAAHGRVLVSGLGLGCVVRGLLARPQVTHVDVVEVSEDVLAMVAPSFEGERRLTIHHNDALTMAWPIGTRWDFAWHDVWGEEPSTQILHCQLLTRYGSIVGRQGAWGMPRWLKRRWPKPLLGGYRADGAAALRLASPRNGVDSPEYFAWHTGFREGAAGQSQVFRYDHDDRVDSYYKDGHRIGRLFRPVPIRD